MKAVAAKRTVSEKRRIRRGPQFRKKSARLRARLRRGRSGASVTILPHACAHPQHDELVAGGGDRLDRREIEPVLGTADQQALRLILALAINFALGALMTLGIGAFAPIMIMVSLLGMNPIAAFPIMMGSCAFLMPVASMQFIRKRKYDLRTALGLAIGGIPAVVLAAALVWSLPLNYIRWLVVIVVIYAAVSLLRASVVESRGQYAA
jgi:hypothetical protein